MNQTIGSIFKFVKFCFDTYFARGLFYWPDNVVLFFEWFKNDDRLKYWFLFSFSGHKNIIFQNRSKTVEKWKIENILTAREGCPIHSLGRKTMQGILPRHQAFLHPLGHTNIIGKNSRHKVNKMYSIFTEIFAYRQN